MCGVVNCALADSPLRVTLLAADHPSGIYLAKEAATFSLLFENLADRDMPLAGHIAFGPVPAGKKPFKSQVTVPIAATAVGAGKSVKLEVPVTFSAAGAYELHFQPDATSDILVVHPSGLQLLAIFTPRGAGAESGKVPVNPWIMPLPRCAAAIADFLPDFAARTSIHRFLLDEAFLFDPEARRVPVVGASLEASGDQLAVLFADFAKAKSALILRVSVPVLDTPDPKSVAAFNQYIADAMVRSHHMLTAIAVAPDLPATVELTDDQILAYRAYYLAAYAAAKKPGAGEKPILLLGSGDALLTHKLLFTRTAKTTDLHAYIDALAITDLSLQLPLARKLLEDTKTPIWLLPPAGKQNAEVRMQGIEPSVPSLALAESLAIIPVPPPAEDRGVTAHLFGGAVIFQRLHPEALPYIAIFQGEDYAVAAVGGFQGNVPVLGSAAAGAETRPSVADARSSATAPSEPQSLANLEVGDDTQSLRVVDTAGNTVDCRIGDTLYVPVQERMVYVLQTGSAEDLAALLRTATAHNMPSPAPGK